MLPEQVPSPSFDSGVVTNILGTSFRSFLADQTEFDRQLFGQLIAETLGKHCFKDLWNFINDCLEARVRLRSGGFPSAFGPSTMFGGEMQVKGAA